VENLKTTQTILFLHPKIRKKKEHYRRRTGKILAGQKINFVEEIPT